MKNELKINNISKIQESVDWAVKVYNEIDGPHQKLINEFLDNIEKIKSTYIIDLADLVPGEKYEVMSGEYKGIYRYVTNLEQCGNNVKYPLLFVKICEHGDFAQVCRAEDILGKIKKYEDPQDEIEEPKKVKNPPKEYIKDWRELVRGQKYALATRSGYFIYGGDIERRYDVENHELLFFSEDWFDYWFNAEGVIDKMFKYEEPIPDEKTVTREVNKYFIYSDTLRIASAMDGLLGVYTSDMISSSYQEAADEAKDDEDNKKIGKILSVTVQYDIKELW